MDGDEKEVIPTQIALRFDEVPITCPTQQRYHAIAPCLAGRCAPADIARQLDVSYATVTRWLREFRDNGLPGLFPATQYPREPYTPEKIIVTLVAYKCFAPKASARELAQVLQRATGHKLHHETAGELLRRYFFWKYPEFRELLTYPVPSDPQARRLEMVKLHEQGWSEKRIADLLYCSRTTVYKWLRRWQQEQAAGLDESARLFGYLDAMPEGVQLYSTLLLLHRAFSRKLWQRKTDSRGFVRVGRWKIYVEEGLPHTPVEISYWDGKLRAEYNAHLLTEYNCRWDNTALRPKEISQPQCFASPYQSRQQTLFDPLWVREPIENQNNQPQKLQKRSLAANQLRLYLGPELVKASG